MSAAYHFEVHNLLTLHISESAHNIWQLPQDL